MIWLWAALVTFIGFCLILLSEFVSDIPLLKTSLHEVGFAAVVAVIIWIVFERLSHDRAEQTWRHRIEKITEEVFYGVLRRRLPRELIKTANELILTRGLVRSGLSLEYELRSGSTTDHDRPVSYVELSVKVTYRIQNMSDDEDVFPAALALPNPILPSLKEKVYVSRIVIQRAQGREELDLTDIRKRFQEQLTTSTEPQVVFYCGDVRLQPNEWADMRFEYFLPKEEEDDEIFQTIFAADSARVKITDRDPLTRVVRARALHPKKLGQEQYSPDSGNYEYHLPHYLLPYQGIVVWWKRAAR